MNPLKVFPTISLVALTALLLLSPLAASAAGATVTVKTDSASYAGAQSLTVFGTVSPTPGASGTFTVINVKNPSGATVLTGEASVSSSDGSFSQGFVTGGSASWISGTYKVNATYAPVGVSVSGSATTTFGYSATGGGGGGGATSQDIKNILGNLSAIRTALNALSGKVDALSSGQSAQNAQLTSIQNSLTSLSGTVSSIQGSLSNVAGTVGSINTALGSVSSKLDSLSGPLSSAGATQTYVLVVAVLAAITLVLELAILVRKLS